MPVHGDESGDADEDLRAEAQTLVSRAEERWKAEDFQGAWEAYTRAIHVLHPLYEEAAFDQVPKIRALDRDPDAPAEELAARIEEIFEAQDRIAETISRWEFESARCLTRLGRPVKAVRALARALSHDSSLWPGIAKDPDFESLRQKFEYEELAFLVGRGQAHFDTGDPVQHASMERNFRKNLGLPPGDPGLGKQEGSLKALFWLATARLGAEAPSRLTFKNYNRLVRLGVLRMRTHRGWAYRHAHLFEADDEIRALQAECQRVFEERRKESDGPYRAMAAFFPAVHLGKTDLAREILVYLHERSAYYYDAALDGLIWLLDATLEAGRSLPETTRAETKAFLDQARSEFAEARREGTQLQAWMGIPVVMDAYGYHQQQGNFGLPKDPVRAIAWFEGAAALGLARAQYHLALCYLYGNGVPRNEKRTFELCAQAADAGNVDAINTLAYCYLYEKGTERDYVQARILFKKAAEKDNGNATESLGMMLQRGLGGPRDYEEARRWFLRSRALKNVRAHRRLGNLALDAREGDADLDEAVTFLTQAAAKAPKDPVSMVYLWTALRLQGKAQEAREAAKAFQSVMEKDEFNRDLIRALAKRKVDTTKLLGKAKRLSDEGERTMALGQVYFVAAVQQLAAGKPKIAKKYFASCVKYGNEVDSIVHSAHAELRRLEGE